MQAPVGRDLMVLFLTYMPSQTCHHAQHPLGIQWSVTAWKSCVAS